MGILMNDSTLFSEMSLQAMEHFLQSIFSYKVLTRAVGDHFKRR